MNRNRLKTILAGLTISLTLLIIGLALAFYLFMEGFEGRLDSRKFLPTTEYFAAPLSFSEGQLLSSSQLEGLLTRKRYRAREPQQILLAGDYVKLDRQQCLEKLALDRTEIEGFYGSKLTPEQLETLSHCFGFLRKSVETGDLGRQQAWVVLAGDQQVVATLVGFPLAFVKEVSLDPPLLAQYSENRPIMQQFKTLSETPTQCLNAVMSIEDSKFLDHGGFSLTGILRAFYKNILTGRRGQGGSTITQQLVKNYFLTHERSIKRKVKEIALAILIESKYTKDEILETYLNIIYMGQNGPFQVLGFGAAAPFYFGKELRDLNTSECALLAAILNGPGVFDPWRKPEKTLQRRNLVLTKMKEFNYVSEEELEAAQKLPLPKTTPRKAAETAPYYIDAVRKQLIENKIPLERSKIYTHLNTDWQQIAQDALQKHLAKLEATSPTLKPLKAKGLNLEGVVLVGDPRTGAVSVAVGGRSFRMTQFNRAVDGHRQVGSIIKPFVYLAALERGAPQENKKYSPLTLVRDEKFNHKYEGQSWSPDNYSKKYFGPIPLFFGLKNSLNAATAALGLEIGLDEVIETLKGFNFKSSFKPLPSLTLGAFEMYPIEVLKAYMGLSRFGMTPTPSFVKEVRDGDDQLLYETPLKIVQAADLVAGASLVSMMKQTLLTGTARSVSASGFTRPAAGKTGTTSDFKDAWFAGFTPEKTALVWVGYDNNLTTNLTGGSGAAPVWLEVMKALTVQDFPRDFDWPLGTMKHIITKDQLAKMGFSQEVVDEGEVELVFPADFSLD